MRNLILVALILQLVIIIIETKDYEFGDIISFKRTYKTKSFRHFAIFVGKKKFDGKTDEQDIFHRIGKGKTAPGADCVFGVLKEEVGEQRKDNYLDGQKNSKNQIINKKTDDEIYNNIKALMTEEGCKKYNVLSNNCEHLATYARYKLRVTKQDDTFAGGFCKLNKPKTCSRLDDLVKDIEDNANLEKECWDDSSCSAMAG